MVYLKLFSSVLTHLITSNSVTHTMVPFILVPKSNRISRTKRDIVRWGRLKGNWPEFIFLNIRQIKILDDKIYSDINFLPSTIMVENDPKYSKITTVWRKCSGGSIKEHMSHTPKLFKHLITYPTNIEEYSR